MIDLLFVPIEFDESKDTTTMKGVYGLYMYLRTLGDWHPGVGALYVDKQNFKRSKAAEVLSECGKRGSRIEYSISRQQISNALKFLIDKKYLKELDDGYIFIGNTLSKKKFCRLPVECLPSIIRTLGEDEIKLLCFFSWIVSMNKDSSMESTFTKNYTKKITRMSSISIDKAVVNLIKLGYVEFADHRCVNKNKAGHVYESIIITKLDLDANPYNINGDAFLNFRQKVIQEEDEFFSVVTEAMKGGL